MLSKGLKRYSQIGEIARKQAGWGMLKYREIICWPHMQSDVEPYIEGYSTKWRKAWSKGKTCWFKVKKGRQANINIQNFSYNMSSFFISYQCWINVCKWANSATDHLLNLDWLVYHLIAYGWIIPVGKWNIIGVILHMLTSTRSTLIYKLGMIIIDKMITLQVLSNQTKPWD